MHDEVHEGEADHGGIEVITVETLLQDVLVLLGEQAADAGADEAVVIGLKLLPFFGLLFG